MSRESLAAVQTAWKRLVEEDVLDARRLRAEVASSWRRCRERGLHSLQRQGDGGDPAELAARLLLKDALLRAARPFLDALYLFVKGAGFQVILADQEGFLLEVLCDDEAVSRTGQSALKPGDDWSEAARGTNAIGTAIAEKRALQISACEHFLKQHHSLTCSAAPIFDPDGELTGVLDISCDHRHANDHTLGMVVVAANGIESQLRLRQAAAERLRREYPHSPPPLDHPSGVALLAPGLFAEAAPESLSFEGIIGESPAILAAKELGKRAALSCCAVLISGESGTGKELFARAIHQAGEGRCRPFVVVNCTGLPEHLVLSELLGRDESGRGGAESGERQLRRDLAGATIFLREVGDLSLPAQLKLLRALRALEPEAGRVRIIASTQKELEAEVGEGRFSPELFRLLDVLRVRLAPLRQRGGDLSLLCWHLARKLALQLGRDGVSMEEGFLRKIRSHSWPGNVRELENALERAVIRAGRAGVLSADLLDGGTLLSSRRA